MRVADRDPNYDTNSKTDRKIFSYDAQYDLASQPAYPASYLIMLHVRSHEENGGDAVTTRASPRSSLVSQELEHTILVFAIPKLLSNA
jgi:hypothetical protein